MEMRRREKAQDTVFQKSLDRTSSDATYEEKPRTVSQNLEEVYGCCCSALKTFDMIPEWMQDNHFILHGYRVDMSFVCCMKSLFKYHNETLNIWTHLLAAIFFFVVMVLILTESFLLGQNATGVDKAIFTVFLICAQCQMLFSALFHIFCCHSPGLYKWLARLDYTGISLMIVGSCYPPLYYGLYCNPNWRFTYMTFITLFGVFGICVSCISIFATPQFRLVRTGFFLVFGFFAVFPFPHIMYLNGLDFSLPLLYCELFMGSFYVIGTMFYGSRFPERYFPGKFDYTLVSHVIWHFFTIIAALLQLKACLFAYDHRQQHLCALELVQ